MIRHQALIVACQHLSNILAWVAFTLVVIGLVLYAIGIGGL